MSDPRQTIDTSGNISAEVIKVLRGQGIHAFTINMYRSSSRVMINGPGYDTFSSKELPYILANLDNNAEMLRKASDQTKLHITQNLDLARQQANQRKSKSPKVRSSGRKVYPKRQQRTGPVETAPTGDCVETLNCQISKELPRIEYQLSCVNTPASNDDGGGGVALPPAVLQPVEEDVNTPGSVSGPSAPIHCSANAPLNTTNDAHCEVVPALQSGVLPPTEEFLGSPGLNDSPSTVAFLQAAKTPNCSGTEVLPVVVEE